MRFDDERPLTARSVLLSTLLGTDPPWLPTRRLVRAAALFGITEGAARTALSRMTARGELQPDRDGHRLTGPLLDRQARQRASRHPAVEPWDGRWVIGLVAGERRTPADRAAFRAAMGRARHAELREGAWGRPDNLGPPPALPCQWWRGQPEEPAAELAARLWELGPWARHAVDLRGRLRSVLPALRRHDTDALAPGFVLSAAVLRHLQRDPLLPDELLPKRWPGEGLRADYDRFDEAYRAVLGGWLRATPPKGLTARSEPRGAR